MCVFLYMYTYVRAASQAKNARTDNRAFARIHCRDRIVWIFFDQHTQPPSLSLAACHPPSEPPDNPPTPPTLGHSLFFRSRAVFFCTPALGEGSRNFRAKRPDCRIFDRLVCVHTHTGQSLQSVLKFGQIIYFLFVHGSHSFIYVELTRAGRERAKFPASDVLIWTFIPSGEIRLPPPPLLPLPLAVLHAYI